MGAGRVKQMTRTGVLAALIVKTPKPRIKLVRVSEIPLAQFMKEQFSVKHRLPCLHSSFSRLSTVPSSSLSVGPSWWSPLSKCHWLICSLGQAEVFSLKGSFFVFETRTHSSNLIYWPSRLVSDGDRNTICHFVFNGHLIIFYITWENSWNLGI